MAKTAEPKTAEHHLSTERSHSSRKCYSKVVQSPFYTVMPNATYFLNHPDATTRNIAHAYADGAFLMDNDGEGIHLYTVQGRAIVPMSEDEGLHIPRRLRRELKHFEPRWNTAYRDVIEGCRGHLPGAPARDGEWISEELATLYEHLHFTGLSHSFEVWRDGKLAGGILGIALGGNFVAESKFHRVSNASKVALILLAQHLKQRGFTILDAQIQNPHIATLGVYEIDNDEYQDKLRHALRQNVDIY